MAKLRVHQSIENAENAVLFSIDAGSVSSSDRDLISKFGEPEINFGGVIKDDDTVTTLVTLPDEFVKVVSGLPFKKVINAAVEPWDTGSANKLACYRKRVIERFTSAFEDLRDESDTYTNEFVTTL